MQIGRTPLTCPCIRPQLMDVALVVQPRLNFEQLFPIVVAFLWSQNNILLYSNCSINFKSKAGWDKYNTGLKCYVRKVEDEAYQNISQFNHTSMRKAFRYNFLIPRMYKIMKASEINWVELSETSNKKMTQLSSRWHWSLCNGIDFSFANDMS